MVIKPCRSYTIAVLGGAGVGKTALVNRFAKGIFLEECEATIEDVHTRLIDLEGYPVQLRVVDIGGISAGKGGADTRWADNVTERQLSYISSVDAVVLCFSVAQRHSLQQAKAIHTAVRSIRGALPTVLVGTMADTAMDADRQLRAGDGKRMAESLGIGSKRYMEVCARSNRNCNNVFFDLTRFIISDNVKAVKMQQQQQTQTQQQSGGSGRTQQHSHTTHLSDSGSVPSISGHGNGSVIRRNSTSDALSTSHSTPSFSAHHSQTTLSSSSSSGGISTPPQRNSVETAAQIRKRQSLQTASSEIEELDHVMLHSFDSANQISGSGARNLGRSKSLLACANSVGGTNVPDGGRLHRHSSAGSIGSGGGGAITRQTSQDGNIYGPSALSQISNQQQGGPRQHNEGQLKMSQSSGVVTVSIRRKVGQVGRASSVRAGPRSRVVSLPNVNLGTAQSGPSCDDITEGMEAKLVRRASVIGLASRNSQHSLKANSSSASLDAHDHGSDASSTEGTSCASLPNVLPHVPLERRPSKMGSSAPVDAAGGHNGKRGRLGPLQLISDLVLKEVEANLGGSLGAEEQRERERRMLHQQHQIQTMILQEQQSQGSLVRRRSTLGRRHSHSGPKPTDPAIIAKAASGNTVGKSAGKNGPIIRLPLASGKGYDGDVILDPYLVRRQTFNHRLNRHMSFRHGANNNYGAEEIYQLPPAEAKILEAAEHVIGAASRSSDNSSQSSMSARASSISDGSATCSTMSSVSDMSATSTATVITLTSESSVEYSEICNRNCETGCNHKGKEAAYGGYIATVESVGVPEVRSCDPVTENLELESSRSFSVSPLLEVEETTDTEATPAPTEEPIASKNGTAEGPSDSSSVTPPPTPPLTLSIDGTADEPNMVKKGEFSLDDAVRAAIAVVAVLAGSKDEPEEQNEGNPPPQVVYMTPSPTPTPTPTPTPPRENKFDAQGGRGFSLSGSFKRWGSFGSLKSFRRRSTKSSEEDADGVTGDVDSSRSADSSAIVVGSIPNNVADVQTVATVGVEPIAAPAQAEESTSEKIRRKKSVLSMMGKKKKSPGQKVKERAVSALEV